MRRAVVGAGSSFSIEDGVPEARVFCDLRAACGWGEVDPADAAAALSASILCATARADGNVVGFGRVVGDGVLYFYLQDMIVAPEWRGRGVGRALVSHLMARIRARAASGATIGLMAAEGAAGFYARFGFRTRPAPGYGPGMTQFIGDDR